MRKIGISDSVQEMFPDWREIEPGDWSKNGKLIEYAPNEYLEVSLHREQEGEYTLHVFDNDEVLLCREVYRNVEELEFVWGMTESEWSRMTIDHLTKNINGKDFYGKVCVGDLSIEFQHTLDLSAWYLYTNVHLFDVGEEDDVYGDFEGTPYTMLDCNIEVPIVNSFEEFKKECEIAISKMIEEYELEDDAYKPVAKWAYK